MRNLSFFPVLFFLASLLLLACDDSSGGSKPAVSPELSTVVASPVRYDRERDAFVTEITVTVVNVKEQTVAGVPVYLGAGSGNAVVDEVEKITDAEGKAVFKVVSHHVENVEITASEVKKSNNDADMLIPLAQPVTVHFTAKLTVEPVSNPIYNAQQGAFSLRLHLTDEVGDVAQAELAYQEMDNGLMVSPVEMMTNDQGVAEFSATTSRGDTYRLDFELSGIEDFLSVDAELLGPSISGSIDVGMSYPEFTHPRVGIFGLNVFDEPPAIFGELSGSVPVDMNADAPSFEIHLPIVPPSEWLREVNAGIYAGYFPPALYNDDNENGVWDPEEFIIAAHGTPGALVFLYLPADPGSPHAGWRFVEEIGGRAQPMPWEDAANAQDMLVTAAPVRTPGVQGAVETTLSVVRVAFYAVDGPLFSQMVQNGQNPWTLIFDPAHAARLLDVPVVATNFDGEAADPRVVLNAATLEVWSVVTPATQGFELVQLPILPFTYVDANENGSLDEGTDMVATTLEPPFGVTWFITYILDFPRIGGFFSTDHLWMHPGWNWIATPKEYEIRQVIVNMPGFPTLQLNENVPAGLSEIHFEVQDPGTGDLKASGTFASGTLADYINITTCLDCGNIQVGDRLVVTEVISEATAIDWAEPMTFGAIYGP